jgi:hypothetical protein
MLHQDTVVEDDLFALFSTFKPRNGHGAMDMMAISGLHDSE